MICKDKIENKWDIKQNYLCYEYCVREENG